MSNGNFPNGTVSVKALVWSYRNDQPAYEVCADCPFGRYAISPAGEHGYGWKQPRQNVWSGFLPTCDEAKAAAQDDYESRILSTLLPTPKLEAEPVGYVTEVELAQLRLGVSCIDLFGKVVPKGFAMVPLYAHPPKPEPVGWETEAEWDLEMRCFNITENTPFDEVSKLINDLWQQYCLAAEPKPEATEGVAHQVNHSNPVVSQNTQIVEDNATEGGAHEKGIVAACKALGHEGVYISDATLKRAIDAYRAALTAKEGGE